MDALAEVSSACELLHITTQGYSCHAILAAGAKACTLWPACRVWHGINRYFDVAKHWWGLKVTELGYSGKGPT